MAFQYYVDCSPVYSAGSISNRTDDDPHQSTMSNDEKRNGQRVVVAQRGGDIKCQRCVFFPFGFYSVVCVCACMGLGKVQLIKIIDKRTVK